MSHGKAAQLCQEVAREAGEPSLLPAQPWPCHAGPRDCLGQGLAATGKPQFPSSKGERRRNYCQRTAG